MLLGVRYIPVLIRHFRRELQRLVLLAAFGTLSLTAAVVAACGGGGGGSTLPAPPAVAHPTPSAPQVVSTSIPFSNVGVPIALPGVGGFTESITVPSNNQSSTSNTFVVSIATQPFNGLPKVSSAQRKPLAQHAATGGSHHYAVSPSGGTALLYFTVGSSVAASFTAIPNFKIFVPLPTTGESFYLAIYDPTNAAAGWQTAGPLTISGSVVSFSGAGIPFNILAGTQYGLALYYVLASPSPSPSPPPSPSPSPSLTPSPSPSPSTSVSPSPSPSPSTVACTSFRAAHTMRLLFRSRPAVVPARVGHGPARRVCPDVSGSHVRCMSWIRTDIVRTLSAGPAGYGPAELQSAYNLTAASGANGGSQVVAIVDAYDDPNAEADLGVYRSTFALPVCTTANGCFLKVNQSGMTSPLPSTDPTGGWESEESLDLDMVSAVCPNCRILLVEAASSFSSDMYPAEDTAATTCGANVISNSWDSDEYSSEVFEEAYFNHSGVMITVSSGDNGFEGSGTGYPAASQYVTAVGGTSLLHSAGSRSESAWVGTGSRCSLYIAQPSWQTNLGSAYTSICGNRIDNDVAAVADPNTGVAIYDSFGGPAGCLAWCVFGGTSASAPIIGAIYALAGNGSSLTYGSYSYSHLGSLFDIVSGSNGLCGAYVCNAAAGFDGPTGNGTPNGIGAF
jgi:hypothetical protein